MITPMKKYTFLIQSSQYEHFIAQLQEAGVVDVTTKAQGSLADAQLEEALSKAEDIRHLLKQGCPDQMLKEEADIRARIEAIRQEQRRVAPWGDFEAQIIEKLKNEGHEIYFYTCPSKQFDPSWGVIVSEVSSLIYFISLQPVENESVTAFPMTKSAVALDADLSALNGLLTAAVARKEAWLQSHRESLEEELQRLENAINVRQVTLSADDEAEGAVKLLEGFCPVENCEALEQQLSEAACYYESEEPQEGDKTPVKLYNNWFTKLFEPLTGMYGWPTYKEFDPTPILAPFYLLFFALCIGDMGYGIAIALVGYLIYKGKLKIDMFDGLGGIIMALGVGCIIVGYLMGGFFGINLYTASWFPEWAKVPMFSHWIGDGSGKVLGYDVMMVLSIVIGVFHICLAMTIKAISYTMRFGFRQMASTWGWLILIVGGIVTGILMTTSLISARAAGILMIVIGAISGLGIYLFNTPGRNPLINIGGGLWDTYQMATGILGDVLSYIRLYALGLAGAMLGAAFNDLGLMVLGDAPGIGSWIGFVVIVVFGHVLNLLMACLGAFVHPLRLTFVEYFKNSGYEGLGKLYKPFKK